jgi:ribosomal protein L11 methyltransferase
VRQLTFKVPAGELETVLDGFIHRLPRGVRTTVEDGIATVEVIGPALSELPGVPEDAVAGEVPADFQLRRPRGGVVVAGRVLIRSPDDEPRPGLIDVEVAWEGAGFGSGSHPTTRMCAAMLLDVPPAGGLVDVGCGLGTLAILACRLGFRPVTAVDRDEAALGQARRNFERNGSAVTSRLLDVEAEPVPYEATMVVNAPPAVHARVAHLLPAGTATVIASGYTAPESAVVLGAYAAAGLAPADERPDDDGVWGAARLVRADG